MYINRLKPSSITKPLSSTDPAPKPGPFTLCFDGQQVVINSEGPDRALAAELIESLFSDQPPEAPPDTPVRAHFAIRHRPDLDTPWVLRHDQTPTLRVKHLNLLADTLVGEVLRHLIHENDRSIALHAALVSDHRGALLLPAVSGSGKTLIAAWFTAQGFHYHTDEAAAINLTNGRLRAFSRPLSVKSHGLAAVGTLLNLKQHEQHIIRSRHATLIPRRLLNPQPVPDIPPLRAIIFPRFEARKPPAMAPISSAEAGMTLMCSNVNARNLARHGFGHVTQLVREVPAFRLNYRAYHELPELLDGLPPGIAAPFTTLR